MAKKIQYKLDDYGFDKALDDLDRDLDMDFMEPKIKDDRKPSTKVAIGFAKGVKDTVHSESFITHAIKSLLPAGYGSATDTFIDARNSLKDLYNTTSEELKPIVPDLQRLTEKVLPSTKRFIPDSLAKKLEKFANSRDRGFQPHSYQTPEDNEIEKSLTEIFRIQAQESAKKDYQDSVKDQLKEGLSLNKHREMIGQLSQMRISLNQLVSYQNKINANFQRKSLELQYRQYFLARDSFIEQKKQGALTQTLLESINKNSALPDYVKLKQSERLGEALRNRFINSALNGIFGNRSGFVGQVGQRLKKNLKDQLAMNVAGFRFGLSGIESGLDAAQAMQGMGMDDPYSTAGQFLGAGALHASLGSRFGNRLRERITKNQKVGTLNNQLSYWTNNIPQLAEKFAKSSWGSFGLGSFLVNPLKDAIMQGRMQRQVDVDNIKNLQEPGVFTRQTNKTIIEVIPGLLSRIHHELLIMRTGDAKAEPITYDYIRNKFNNQSTARKNVVNMLINPFQKESVSRDINDLIDKIDPQKKLDANARKALGTQLLQDNVENRMASPERLSNTTIYRGDAAKYADQYAGLFRNYFQDDTDWKKRADFSRRHNDLARFIGVDKQKIQDIVNSGLGSALVDAGILSFGGPDSRDPSGNIDFNKYFSYHYSDSYKPSSTDNGKVGSARFFQSPEELQSLKEPGAIHDLPGSARHTTRNVHVHKNDLAPVIEAIQAISPIELLTVIQSSLMSIDTRLAAGIPTLAAGSLSPEELKKLLSNSEQSQKVKEGILKQITKKGFNFLRKGQKFSDFLVGGAIREVGNVFTHANRIAGSLFDSVTARGKELTDVFVGSDPKPVLEAWKLKAKQYFDEATRKPITKFSDIRGSVVDENGKTVLKAEDIKKAYSRTRAGIKSLVSLGALPGREGIANWFRRFRGMDLRKTGLFGHRTNTALGKAKSIYDVYVKGQAEPILSNWKLKAGIYKDAVTGAPLTTFKNIKNNIIDSESGKTITLEELKSAFTKTVSGIKPFTVLGNALKGGASVGNFLGSGVFEGLSNAGKLGGGIVHHLFKPRGEGEDGKPGKSIFEQGTGLFGRGALNTFSLLGKAGNYAVSGLGEGFMNFAKLFGFSLDSIFQGRRIVNRLSDIYKLLDDRLPGKKIRKGSYEDQVEEAKEKESAAAKAEGLNGKLGGAWRNSIFGMGAAGLGKLIDKMRGKPKTDAEGNPIEEGLVGGATGWLAGKAGGLLKKIPGAKTVGSLASKFGKFGGKALKFGAKGALGALSLGLSAKEAYDMISGKEEVSAGNVASAAAPLLISSIGRSALLGAGSLALDAAAGIVGVVGLPVLAGAAAVGGLGYLGYKYFTRKKLQPLSTVRYAQYGFADGDDDRFRKILSFEEICSKTIIFEGEDRAHFDERKINSYRDDIADIFEIDLKNKDQAMNWGKWFVLRFKPIYIKHMLELRKISKETKLADVDDKISTEGKLKYLNATMLPNGPYDVLVSPFPQLKSLTVNSTNIQAIFAKAKEALEKEKKDNAEPGFLDKLDNFFGLGPLKKDDEKEAQAKGKSGTDASQPISKKPSFGGMQSLGSVIGASMAAGMVQNNDITKVKMGPLTRIRMTQYGIDPRSDHGIQALLVIDSFIVKYLKSTDGVYSGEYVNFEKKDLAKMYFALGLIGEHIKTEAKTFKEQAGIISYWLKTRYSPVVNAHANAFKTIGKKIDILNEDTAVSAKDKLKFIELACPDSMHYPKVRSPFLYAHSTPMNGQLVTDTINAFKAQIQKDGASTDDTKEDKSKSFFDKIKDFFSFGAKKDETNQATAPSNTASAPKKPLPSSSVFPTTNTTPVSGGNAAAGAASTLAGTGAAGLTAKQAMDKLQGQAETFNMPGPGGVRVLTGNASENRKLVISMAKAAGITDPKELAMFLANLDEESGGFKRLEENLHYSPSRLIQVFGKYVHGPQDAQALVAGGPQAIASRVYGNRMGNNGAGEGWTYRGRGFIQLTGKSNYAAASKALGIDLINNPDLASDPTTAAKIALWYWKSRGSSAAAKAGDFRKAVYLINGGYNGLPQRQALYSKYLAMTQKGELEGDDKKAKEKEMGQPSMAIPGSGAGDALGGDQSVKDPFNVDKKVTDKAKADAKVGSQAPVNSVVGAGYGSSAASTKSTASAPPTVNPVSTGDSSVYTGISPQSTMKMKDLSLQQKENAANLPTHISGLGDSIKENVSVNREILNVNKQALDVLTTISKLLSANGAKVGAGQASNPIKDIESKVASTIDKAPIQFKKLFAT